MRMSSILITAAALLTAVPALAESAPEQSFERDGMTYTYKVATSGSRTIVSGPRSDGKRFALTIANGKVSGTSGGMPVAFRVVEARPGAQIAAR